LGDRRRCRPRLGCRRVGSPAKEAAIIPSPERFAWHGPPAGRQRPGDGRPAAAVAAV